MITAAQQRFCLACNKPFRGRTDKKYCDDNCRNNYNNQLKADTNNLVRNVNNALAKNRRILQSIINPGEEIAKTTKEKLLQQGFHFKFLTHKYSNKKGSVYFFCYDYGYLPLENEAVLVVKGSEENFM